MYGYKVSKSPWTANTDLSTIFKARTSTKIADIGYSDGGVNLSETYEPIGSTTKVNDVGYSEVGADISTLFMDINASPLVQLANVTASVSDLTLDYNMYAGFELQADGDYGKYINSGSQTQPAFTDLGDWLSDKTGIVASNYEFNMVKVSGTDPSMSGGAVIHADSNTWADVVTSLWYRATGLNTSFQGTLQVREKADIGNIASCTITITTINGE